VQQDEFEGLQGLVEGWGIWMQPWESFHVATEDLVDAGEGEVLFLGRATARLRDSGVDIPQEIASLFGTEGGRIASIRYYLDQAQARRDAGLG